MIYTKLTRNNIDPIKIRTKWDSETDTYLYRLTSIH